MQLNFCHYTDLSRHPVFFYTSGCSAVAGGGGGAKLTPRVYRVLWHIRKKFQQLYPHFRC